ncbi:CRISPR-associated helicase Cas3' [Thiocapsa sp. UBA6158]|uniref:CRISPR-associated helicase Cas3' n=1 Tax=Thiocapsa sp. UBA6158 TaxID=1947692 RepID=UPI0025F7229F|nr:CRISPR-associated helicase Cas3' [Thiocapsa sp. UBA6158]
MSHYSHSRPDQPRESWRRLCDHLESTGASASTFAAKWGASEWGRALGLLHDVGKYSDAAQARIAGLGARVDHSTAGAQIATRTYSRADLGRLLAYAVAGHHGGMPDGSGNDEGTLDQRLGKAVHPHAAWADEIMLPAELPPVPLRSRPGTDATRAGFAMHVLVRMLFSALVDADRLDAEQGDAGRGSPHTLHAIARRLDRHMAGFAPTSEVNRIRAEILAAVRGRTHLPAGLFTLTVPTGGGKTLASLVWALNHARVWGRDRVIYVAPYTSIIEQTAANVRNALGPLGEAVLEHHSATPDSGDEDAERRIARAAENWDMPLVITTAVQFFESLFSNKPARARKLHNIARSVVILDEAQTLPPQLLRPCLAMIDELARNYGCSILLCTATQPAVTEHAGDDRSLSGGLVHAEVRELIPPETLRLHERLRRVSVQHGGTMTDRDVAQALAGAEQGLVIVNTRRHARDLYRLCVEMPGATHLSALMHPTHRSTRLAEIRQRLRDGAPVRLVATTVIEAGVDVDFGRVWRAMAGLDNIAQAAGRCNREGRRALADSLVTIFEPADPQAIPKHFRVAANATRAVLQWHAEDLLSPQAIRAYFRSYYGRRDLSEGGLDAEGIMALLAGTHIGHRYPFATIANLVKLIDEDAGEGVVIPAAPDVVEALAHLQRGDRLSRPELRRAYRVLQAYTVQAPRKAVEALAQSGAIERLTGDEASPGVLRDLSLYRSDVGLDVI